MPAAAKLTPGEPESWPKIGGRAEMVERNTWISAERKRYLIEDRIPSWDDWAKNYRVRQDEIRRGWREAQRPVRRGSRRSVLEDDST
jgi:ribosomal protein L39E